MSSNHHSSCQTVRVSYCENMSNSKSTLRSSKILAHIDESILKKVKVSITRIISGPCTSGPLKRTLEDPSELKVHYRPDEGVRPIFDREDIVVNLGTEELNVRTLRYSPSPNRHENHRRRSCSRSPRRHCCHIYRSSRSSSGYRPSPERRSSQSPPLRRRSRGRSRTPPPLRRRSKGRSRTPPPLRRRSRTPPPLRRRSRGRSRTPPPLRRRSRGRSRTPPPFRRRSRGRSRTPPTHRRSSRGRSRTPPTLVCPLHDIANPYLGGQFWNPDPMKHPRFIPMGNIPPGASFCGPFMPRLSPMMPPRLPFRPFRPSNGPTRPKVTTTAPSVKLPQKGNSEEVEKVE